MLLFLYDSEVVLAGFLGVDEETFSARAFEMVEAISRLKPHYVSLLAVVALALLVLAIKLMSSLLHCFCRSNGRTDTVQTLGREPKLRLMELTSDCHSSTPQRNGGRTNSRRLAIAMKFAFVSKLERLFGSMVRFRVVIILISPYSDWVYVKSFEEQGKKRRLIWDTAVNQLLLFCPMSLIHLLLQSSKMIAELAMRQSTRDSSSSNV